MRFRNRHQLEVYLAREVLGKQLKRKPPQKERKGPARDSAYLAFIRQQPSLISGQYGCEAAHTGSDGGMSQKASDYSCVPLTPAEHREYHRIGKAAFARKHGLDYDTCARRLYAEWRARRAA
jgi:hypothetical protein